VIKRVKSYEVRSYIPEKKQKGRRDWQDKRAEQQAVYANRRRERGDYGKSLLRRRGELIERSFAHCTRPAVCDAVICGGGRAF
jgi:transposase